MNRRTLIKTSSLTLAACSTIPNTQQDSAEPDVPEVCTETLSQQEGPFYSETLVNTMDLSNGASADIIHLFGILVDTNCNPIEGAKIDIWHANTEGEYDLSEGERIHYGYLQTAADGSFSVRTILPGAYLNGPNNYRPRHYHIKIWYQETELLTTQLYFADDEFLEYEPNIPQSLMLTKEATHNGWDCYFQFVVEI